MFYSVKSGNNNNYLSLQVKHKNIIHLFQLYIIHLKYAGNSENIITDTYLASRILNVNILPYLL